VKNDKDLGDAMWAKVAATILFGSVFAALAVVLWMKFGGSLPVEAEKPEYGYCHRFCTERGAEVVSFGYSCGKDSCTCGSSKK
jgi:hypothetical protein